MFPLPVVAAVEESGPNRSLSATGYTLMGDAEIGEDGWEREVPRAIGREIEPCTDLVSGVVVVPLVKRLRYDGNSPRNAMSASGVPAVR